MLDAIRARLDDGLISDAIARAAALRREREGAAIQRGPQVERELAAVEQRLTRLVDAITAGGPVEKLLERLRAERARKAALVEEQRSLNRPGIDDVEGLVARLTAHAAKLRRLLGAHVGRTRALLQSMLTAPMVMTPTVLDGRRGYRFTGRLRLGGLLCGDGSETRHVVVAPTGPDQTYRIQVRDIIAR